MTIAAEIAQVAAAARIARDAAAAARRYWAELAARADARAA